MPRAYPEEFRQRAVELARQREQSVSQIAADLGIAQSALHRWVRQADVDEGQRDGLTTEERAEIVRLRRANRVLWLSEIGLDIRCVRVRAADTGGAKYLDIDQVLPLPEATDFMVRAKAKAAEVAEQKTRGERTIQVLVRNGQVTTGTELVLMPKRLQHPYTPEDSTLLRAKVGEAPTAQANVIWEFDGAPYSLSHLCEILRDTHDVPLAGGGLNGYWYWARADDPSLSLWELARQLSE